MKSGYSIDDISNYYASLHYDLIQPELDKYAKFHVARDHYSTSHPQRGPTLAFPIFYPDFSFVRQNHSSAFLCIFRLSTTQEEAVIITFR
ncbi:hypothetical protein TNCT_344301 [Trichonephila clavata]|uniref:Uncharacterized protein n=1 Tax=Trichonephila clavata TaxID=2740835 RepID=A0A8X6FGG8_TRICU|nr:hypothetical protein TNCT_344301 [Trichonephila clavata]